MKLILAMLLSSCLWAAPRSVTLTWATTDTGVTFDVYRARASCPYSGTFTQITSGVTTFSYRDLQVSPGATYCYQVTDTNGVQVGPALNQVQATIPKGQRRR